MKLEELGKSLLYNSISDIWFAMAEEKAWNWYDIAALKKFVQYLKENKIQIRMLPVCPAGAGDKAEFAKRVSALLGDPNKTFVIRTDGETVKKVKSFEK
ncbi:MAG: hypothetical protein FJ358_02080 [Thaumarchaeota archaeon]|nr:hypothetical protein [Nitrososphaerota archaeon]